MASKKNKTKSESSSVKVDRSSSSSKNESFFDRIQTDLETNQSYLNLILGALIVIVIGILLFNYFTKPQTDLGPSQNTENNQTADVAKENLPGKYTVKEGDTLFTIAQNYYGDGYKYSEIVKENKLDNENSITVGQVLTIPKLETTTTASASPDASSAADMSLPTTQPSANPVASNEKGAAPDTMMQQTSDWGPKISGTTYTVQAGDWLSTISARAYGDVYSFDKIAKVNNITDPNLIEVGTVLQIPR